MSDQAPPTETESYPRYFQTMVGIAPDRLKLFSAKDMEALIEAFAMATGVSPLEADRPLTEIFKEAVGAH